MNIKQGIFRIWFLITLLLWGFSLWFIANTSLEAASLEFAFHAAVTLPFILYLILSLLRWIWAGFTETKFSFSSDETTMFFLTTLAIIAFISEGPPEFMTSFKSLGELTSELTGALFKYTILGGLILAGLYSAGAILFTYLDKDNYIIWGKPKDNDED